MTSAFSQAMDDGFVARLLLPGGAEDVDIGTPLIVMVEEEEEVAAFKAVDAAAFAGAAAPEAAAPAGGDAGAAAPAPAPAAAPAAAPASAAPAAAGDVPRRRRRYKHAATGWTLTVWE